jgi:hypothetical protein
MQRHQKRLLLTLLPISHTYLQSLSLKRAVLDNRVVERQVAAWDGMILPYVAVLLPKDPPRWL